MQQRLQPLQVGCQVSHSPWPVKGLMNHPLPALEGKESVQLLGRQRGRRRTAGRHVRLNLLADGGISEVQVARRLVHVNAAIVHWRQGARLLLCHGD